MPRAGGEMCIRDSRYGDTEKRAEALAREVGRLRSLNAEKLHSSEAEEIASRMALLLAQLRQEA